MVRRAETTRGLRFNSDCVLGERASPRIERRERDAKTPVRCASTVDLSAVVLIRSIHQVVRVLRDQCSAVARRNLRLPVLPCIRLYSRGAYQAARSRANSGPTRSAERSNVSSILRRCGICRNRSASSVDDRRIPRTTEGR